MMGGQGSNVEVGDIVVKPGQMWLWAFSVGSGTYFFEAVTAERRETFMPTGDSNYMIVKRGESFVIISTYDPGPAMPPNVPIIDEWGHIESPAQPPKDWHVAMLNGKLVWIDQEMYQHAELVGHV